MMRSSSEWKLTTASRPPSRNSRSAAVSPVMRKYRIQLCWGNSKAGSRPTILASG